MYVSLRYGRIFEREPLPVISFIPIEATADLSGANLCFEHPKDTAEDFLNQAESTNRYTTTRDLTTATPTSR